VSVKTFLWSLLGSVICFFGVVAPAISAPLLPAPAIFSGPPSPPGQRCTVEALNVNGVVTAGGAILVPNVPTNQGGVRLRATCADPFGATLSGQSSLVVPIPGGTVDAGNVDFGAVAPIAAKLTVAPAALTLTGVGASVQLAVGSTFADHTSADVTAASFGTRYRSSNSKVATVSPDGLVTAVGLGTAILSALNEGAIGLMTVTVRSAPLVSLAVTPTTVSITQSPIFTVLPVQLQAAGLLSDGKIINLSAESSGVTYSSSAPGVAAVSPDGAVVGVSAGAATITVTDSQTGSTALVPVTVTSFSPAPFAAYRTPAFAHNVDISGTLAFVADDVAGLQILDTSSGAVVGKLSFGGQPALDVRVRGTLAAVALGPSGFALASVADPAQPRALATVSSAGNVGDLWVSGDRLYAASTTGLRVYDIGNPAAPILVGAQLGFSATAVAADSARGLTVVLTNQPAVMVVQTGGPGPWPAVSLPLPPAINQADDVVLFGTRAYVANGRDGLREVDVTNPASPAFKASSALNFNALGVAMRTTDQGTIVAAADNFFINAVPLFNAELANTFNVDFSTFPGDIKSDADGTGIALGDGFGVVTVGAAGIQVFRTQQLNDNAGMAPTVSLTDPGNSSHVLSGDFIFVTATATDDVGVAFVEFLVDGAVVATDTVSPFSAAILSAAPCSAHVFQARATDRGGNVGTSLPVNIRVFCADGQGCTEGADCASGDCAGSVCQPCNAGGTIHPSCAALKAVCPAAASGSYTIDPGLAGPGTPFSVYCEMSLGGGGWTLAAKMTNQDQKRWVDAKTSWTSTNFYGSAADLSVGQDAKSQAWGTVPATEILLTDDLHKAGGGYVQTISNCLGGVTPSQFFTVALANYPDPSGQTHYKKCSTYNTYIPGWTVEPGWQNQVSASPSNALNQGYLTIAKADVGDTQAVISFYADGLIAVGPDFLPGTEPEADVGLGSSERDGVPFGLGDGQKQDIGGATSCGTNDASCAAQYPESVYVFIR
jgi:hypothetical protein